MMQPKEEKREGIDLSEYAMNPVEIAEKADKMPALRRSIKAFGLVAAIVLVAVAIAYWARMGHQTSLHGVLLDQARDTSIRMKAEGFKESLVSYVPALEGRLEAVRFEESNEPGAFVIGLAIKPAITDETGVTRPTMDAEVRQVLRIAARELASFLESLEVVQYKTAIARGYIKGALVGTERYEGPGPARKPEFEHGATPH